jgi:hypothetical protein
MRIVGRDKLTKAERDCPGSGLGKALDAWVKVTEGGIGGILWMCGRPGAGWITFLRMSCLTLREIASG